MGRTRDDLVLRMRILTFLLCGYKREKKEEVDGGSGGKKRESRTPNAPRKKETAQWRSLAEFDAVSSRKFEGVMDF